MVLAPRRRAAARTAIAAPSCSTGCCTKHWRDEPEKRVELTERAEAAVQRASDSAASPPFP